MLPHIEDALRQWHEMVSARNLNALPKMLHPDVVFLSPFVFTPYRGSLKTHAILATVVQVFRDFQYHREFVEGESAALEFTAKVGDFSLKGIDLITFNGAGQIVEFEVLIRPASGLQALSEAMGKRLAEQGVSPK
jgi:hypothetical protein